MLLLQGLLTDLMLLRLRRKKLLDPRGPPRRREPGVLKLQGY